MGRPKGFSLIELMVVVAIIAIIAAFAVPSYLQYSLRARRGDAQNLLLRVADAQERYYATNNRYGSLDELAYSSSAAKHSENGYYELSMDPSSGTSSAFTATATPVAGGPQEKDDCGALTINNAGVKSQDATTTNGSCW